MSVLESVHQQVHKILFHTLIYNTTPVNALNTTPVNSLKEKAHEILWHQYLIHVSPQTIKESYKFVDGVPNLSNFDFENITKC